MSSRRREGESRFLAIGTLLRQYMAQSVARADLRHQTLIYRRIPAYQRHPETFFGVRRDIRKNTNDPLSLFEFFYDSFKDAPRSRMLKFLSTAPDFDQLSELSTEDLLLVFCDRHVGAAMRVAGESGK
jgi:hypothetical protein